MSISYLKVISYADILEVTEYERQPTPFKDRQKKKRRTQHITQLSLDPNDRQNTRSKQEANRSTHHKKRAIMGLRRLIQANLSPVRRPLLVTLTYAENMGEIGQARKDFSTFIRNLRFSFPELRYVAIAERQKRGALHFHALIWGVPFAVARAERDARMVANCWGRGFIDLVETDGSPKLANYLIKYFTKSFETIGFGRRSYVASRNMIRPEVGHLLAPHFYLSTVRIVRDIELESIYLGKGRFRKLLVHPETKYENGGNAKRRDNVEEGR